ncbi:MAG: hypothetical protein HRT73_00750 [Flavobacteriales bacterium]|nr:hypothetical protein [Flavobacteriales bacterium]
MEEKEHLNLEQTSTLLCSQCSTSMNESDVFCNSCGFPEKGTSREQAKFHAKAVMKKSNKNDADKKVKSARNTLYVVGGFTGVVGVSSYFLAGDVAVLVTNLILSGIYVLLGFWSTKKPLAALLSGLLLYITVVVINGVFEPETLYKGIIWKILIITYLGKGLYSANLVQKEEK